MKFFKKLFESFNAPIIVIEKGYSYEEKTAIKNFYDLVTLKSISEVPEIVKKHLAVGFKIKADHYKIIETDPFLLLWEKLGDKEYYGNNKKNPIWDLIWNEAIDEEYKQSIKKDNVVLNHYVRVINDNNNTSSIRSWNNLYCYNKTDFFTKNLLNIHTIDTNKYLNSLDNKYKELARWSNLNSSELSIIKTLVEAINNRKLANIDENLNVLFNKDASLEKISKKEVFNQKNITNMLKTLKLYEYKFESSDENSKKIFLNTIENIEKINSTEFLLKNADQEAYVERLLLKHFPELLSDYLELPNNMKYNFKDSNGKTPQNIFYDTLMEINEKINIMLENAFDENITNIRVKNRVMKNN